MAFPSRLFNVGKCSHAVDVVFVCFRCFVCFCCFVDLKCWTEISWWVVYSLVVAYNSPTNFAVFGLWITCSFMLGLHVTCAVTFSSCYFSHVSEMHISYNLHIIALRNFQHALQEIRLNQLGTLAKTCELNIVCDSFSLKNEKARTTFRPL
jgi:phosphotransferase system  glucose/maltose/N-acetylglucosamine-specific IIC component